MNNTTTRQTADTTTAPSTGPTPGTTSETSETSSESAAQRLDRELAELRASGIDRGVWERIGAEHPEDALTLACRLRGLTSNQESSR
jgi:hypothetical protein